MAWSRFGHKCDVPKRIWSWTCLTCGDHWVGAKTKGESAAAALRGEDVRTKEGGTKRPPLW